MSENDESGRFLPELSPLTKLTPSGVSSLRVSDGSLEPGRPSWQRVSPLRDEYALGPTAWSRLGRLYRAEVDTSPRIVERDWIADVSRHVPGLAISLHYDRSDVHEVYSRLRALDLAHRRAASLLMVAGGAAAGSWQPMRPERGGLWLVRSDVGSFECVMTFYGELVNIAASTPVSLAAFASLSLQTTSALKRAGRWFVRLVRDGHDVQPDDDRDSGDVEPWGSEVTKAALAVAQRAIEAGVGFELVHESEDETLRLTVMPRE